MAGDEEGMKVNVFKKCGEKVASWQLAVGNTFELMVSVANEGSVNC